MFQIVGVWVGTALQFIPRMPSHPASNTTWPLMPLLQATCCVPAVLLRVSQRSLHTKTSHHLGPIIFALYFLFLVWQGVSKNTYRVAHWLLSTDICAKQMHAWNWGDCFCFHYLMLFQHCRAERPNPFPRCRKEGSTWAGDIMQAIFLLTSPLRFKWANLTPTVYKCVVVRWIWHR